MAARKPDSEVGPLGVWAYNTTRLLGLSSAQVAARAGVTEPTVRKVEGGSNKTPSRRLIYEMYRYFREVGEQQELPVEPPPGYLGEVEPEPDGQPALTAVLSELALELRESRRQRETIEGRLVALEAELESLRAQRATGAREEQSALVETTG